MLDILARLFGQMEPNRLASAGTMPQGSAMDVFQGRAPEGVASTGDILRRLPDGRIERTSARYGYSEILPDDGQGAPMAQAPAQPPAQPMQSAQSMRAPQPASQPATQPAQSGVGGFLSGLFGNGRAENQTVQWLQGQGFDQGTATALAKNPPLLQQYLKQRMAGNDPKDALEMQKMQLEIEQMRNPMPDYITGRDGSIFQADRSGIRQVYGGKPDQTSDVQEYEYARKQGYQGSFADWQIEQKRAGASQVNIDQKAEGAFDKRLAENQATMFTDMATEGLNARADIGVLGELERLLPTQGGMLTGLSAHLAKYGIGGENVSDLQAAQALINKLVPTQRQPGSGNMSDRDVELFKSSVPSLWNRPDGNKVILNVMRGLADYKLKQGEIANQVLNGTITRQQAAEQLRSLPNPLEGFKAPEAKPEPQAARPRARNPNTGEVIEWDGTQWRPAQ